jgi:hypothetical protein
MFSKFISVLVGIYLVVGIFFAIAWGHVGAMFSSLFALDFTGFFMSMFRVAYVIFLWLYVTSGHPIPF